MAERIVDWSYDAIAVAASTSELANGAMKAVDIGEHELLLAKVEDAHYAVENLATYPVKIEGAEVLIGLA